MLLAQARWMQVAGRWAVGIDPNLTATGVVVVDGKHVVFAETCRTEKNKAAKGLRVADDDAERCQELARFLLRILDNAQVGGAVAELPSGGAQGARPHRAMGLATGVVAAILEACGVAAEWVTPGMVKKASAGRKDASKGDVEAAVLKAFDWSQVTLPKAAVAREHIFDAAGALLAAKDGTLMRLLAGRAQGKAR